MHRVYNPDLGSRRSSLHQLNQDVAEEQEIRAQALGTRSVIARLGAENSQCFLQGLHPGVAAGRVSCWQDTSSLLLEAAEEGEESEARDSVLTCRQTFKPSQGITENITESPGRPPGMGASHFPTSSHFSQWSVRPGNISTFLTSNFSDLIFVPLFPDTLTFLFLPSTSEPLHLLEGFSRRPSWGWLLLIV